MSDRGVLNGAALPVSIVGGDIVDDFNLNSGIEATPATIAIRTVIPEEDALIVSGSVTPTIDKRGYSSVAFYIPTNFTGATKVRAQVSYNAATWFYPRVSFAYIEEDLVTGVAVAVAIYDLFAYPYVRLVFLNATDVQQVQTNLGVKYSLVV